MKKKLNWIPAFIIIVSIMAILFAAYGLWSGVLVIAIIFILSICVKLGSRYRGMRDGRVVLDWGSNANAVALFSTIILAVLIGYGVYDLTLTALRPKDGVINGAIIGMFIFMILTWPLFIETTFSWYIVDSTGISKHSAWSPKFFVKWSEVNLIDFISVDQWFIIKTDKGVIRIPTYVAGLSTFGHLVKDNVPAEKWAPVSEKITNLSDQYEASMKSL